MGKRVVLIVISAVIIIGGASYLLFGRSGGTSTSTATPSPSPTPLLATATTASATITYSSNGFSPASTTVSAGQTVEFINNSSSAIQVDSDPHPAHTDDTDLNVGRIAAGQSKSVVVTKKGTFGLHNHLSPDKSALITIN